MSVTTIRRITVTIAGILASAGIFTGIAAAAPAQAKAAVMDSTCTIATQPVNRAANTAANPLTRAGQVAAIAGESTDRVAVAVSCLNR